MRDERAIVDDLLMEPLESLAVLGHREARNDPHDQAKEVHDRPDIHELDSEPLGSQVHDLETNCLSISAGKLRVPRRTARLWSQEELSQLAKGVGANLLR